MNPIVPPRKVSADTLAWIEFAAQEGDVEYGREALARQEQEMLMREIEDMFQISGAIITDTGPMHNSKRGK